MAITQVTTRDARKANDAEYVYNVTSAKGANIKNVDNDTILLSGNASDYVVKATASGVLITKPSDKQFKLNVTLQKANEKKGVEAGELKLVFANGSVDLKRDGKDIKLEDGTALSKQAKAPTDLATKLDASETYSAVVEANTPPTGPTPPAQGSTFTLTAGADTFYGEAGKNNEITATTATLDATDVLVDTSSSDNDIIKLTATSAVSANGATILGFEKLDVTWDAFGDASIDAVGFKGVKEITASTSKLGNLGNLTVTNAGTATVTAGAGMTGSLTVSDVTAAVVNAGAAKTVVVNGSTAETDSVTVSAGEQTTTITVAASVETANVTAGAKTSSITTNAVTANIDASVALKDALITVNGTAGSTDAATVKIGNDAKVTIGNTFGATEVVTLDVAAGKVVELTASTTANSVTVKGAGDVTLKGYAGELTGDAITKANTGSLTVQLTGQSSSAATVSSFDSSKIAADLFKLTSSTTATLTAKSGQAFEVAAGTATDSITVATAVAGSTDTLSLKLTSANYGTVANATEAVETLTIEAAATQVSGADLTIGNLNVGATNTAVLKGTNDVTISGVTAKVLDASALNGDLVLGNASTAALSEGAVNGAAGKNTVFFGSVASAATATFVGQNGNDVITLTSTAAGNETNAAGQATFVLGGGNDAVNVTGQIAGVLSVDGGAGNDTVTLAINAANNATVVLQFGEGTDTLVLGDGVDLSAMTNLTITGLEVIQVGSSATIGADKLSGQSYTIKGDGFDNSQLTVKGGSSADTINLSNIVASDSALSGVKVEVIGGAGNDVITLGASNETVVFASTADGNGVDTINGFTAGANGDVLDFSAFISTAVTSLVTTAGSLSDDAVAIIKDTTAFGLSAADLKNALNTGTTGLGAWAADTTDAAEQYVFLVAETNGSSYKVYYATSTGTLADFATVELVGTVNATGDFVAGNFA